MSHDFISFKMTIIVLFLLTASTIADDPGSISNVARHIDNLSSYLTTSQTSNATNLSVLKPSSRVSQRFVSTTTATTIISTITSSNIKLTTTLLLDNVPKSSTQLSTIKNLMHISKSAQKPSKPLQHTPTPLQQPPKQPQQPLTLPQQPPTLPQQPPTSPQHLKTSMNVFYKDNQAFFKRKRRKVYQISNYKYLSFAANQNCIEKNKEFQKCLKKHDKKQFLRKDKKLKLEDVYGKSNQKKKYKNILKLHNNKKRTKIEPKKTKNKDWRLFSGTKAPRNRDLKNHSSSNTTPIFFVPHKTYISSYSNNNHYKNKHKFIKKIKNNKPSKEKLSKSVKKIKIYINKSDKQTNNNKSTKENNQHSYLLISPQHKPHQNLLVPKSSHSFLSKSHQTFQKVELKHANNQSHTNNLVQKLSTHDENKHRDEQIIATITFSSSASNNENKNSINKNNKNSFNNRNNNIIMTNNEDNNKNNGNGKLAYDGKKSFLNDNHPPHQGNYNINTFININNHKIYKHDQYMNNIDNKTYHNIFSSHISCPASPPCFCVGKVTLKAVISCSPEAIFPTFSPADPWIREVHLSYLGLSFLPPMAFNALREIDELHLEGNSFRSIHPRSFAGLYLTSLNLAWCHISALPRSLFKDLNRLQNLSLAENRLKHLHRAIFKSLASLVKLSLAGNPFKKLPPSLFRHQKELRYLDLGYCLLRRLPWSLFAGLSRLETLDLRGNRLKQLQPHVFSDLSSLTSFHLAHNPLKKLTSLSFASLKSLKVLNLAENRLNSIHRNAFKELNQLYQLLLSDNKLNYLQPGTFLLPKLQQLSLDGNHLSRLPPEIKFLPALKHLDVSYNRIRSIERCLLADNNHLEKLNLRENPFHCDCSLLWLREAQRRITKRCSNAQKKTPFIPGKCHTPTRLRGVYVTGWSDLKCLLRNGDAKQQFERPCFQL